MKYTYGVYVIELDGDPLHVYVGSTAHSFEKRLDQHNSGKRENNAARVFIRGARGKLRPDLYRNYPRFVTREEAEEFEEKSVDDLIDRGFRVE